MPKSIVTLEAIEIEGQITTCDEYMLTMWAEYACRLETFIDDLLPVLKGVADGSTQVKELDEIIRDIQNEQSGRQAQDTWGEAWHKAYQEAQCLN